jgi:hypothetical protein
MKQTVIDAFDLVLNLFVHVLARFYWTLAIGESCLHEILAFSLDSFLNGRLENATI